MQNTNKQLRKLLHSRHFRSFFKTLSAILAFVLAAAFLMSAISQYFTYTRQMRADADQLSLRLQADLERVQTQSFFASSMSVIGRLLGQRNLLLDDLIATREDMLPFTASSEQDSVELFMFKSQKIYISDTGLYAFADYLDADFVQRLQGGGAWEYWLPRCFRLNIYQSMRQTLSYVRALPLYEAKKTGYLVVNVPIARLAKQASGSRNPAYDACAVFVGDTWLYHDGQELAKHAKNAALTPMQALDAFRGSYPCYAVSSAPERLVSVRYYQAWFKLLLNLFPPLSFMLLCCMGGLLLVLILSLLLSRLMLAPVNALLVQLGATSEGAASEAEELLDGNEFDMLALAFERLNDQLQHSQRIMRNNQPLLRERMITSLLYAPMDLKAHQKELQSCGIEFPYPYFAVVLLSPPQGATYDERTHIALRRTVESVLQELGKVYSTYGESNTTLFLINAQEYENLDTRLEQALRGLQASIAGTLAIRPSFSVGLCAKDEPNLCNAAMRARQNVLLLGAKACAAPEELVTLLGASEYAPAISPQTINTLCTCIVNADQSGAKHLLHEISETYFPASIPLQHARKLSTALCCHVFLTLTEMDLPPAYEQFAQLLKRLEQETDVPRCEALAQSWVHTLLGSRKNLSSESTAYVSKAIDYIEQHYMQRISVPEIAQTACVNPVYLNRLFKQATDKTISEYLNFYRVEQSIPLLLQSDTLVEISAAVGFNEPRGYIRFFKKFYDVTPSEYRRQKSAAQGEMHKL